MGQMVSLIGTWMQSVAEAWLVYRLTGSAALLGMMGFASQIPVFLLATVGGTIADRHNRHHIIVATQCSAMAAASVTRATSRTSTRSRPDFTFSPAMDPCLPTAGRPR